MKHLLQLTTVVLVLVLLLGACGIDPQGATGGPVSVPIIGGTEATTESTEPPVEQYIQTVPAKVDNPDGLPVLNWVCYVQCNWSDEAAQKVNEALAERNMPFRLQFTSISTNLGVDGYIDSLCNDPRVSQEILDAVGNADLLYSYFDDDDKQKYLMPITEYTRDSIANIVPHEVYWAGARVGGEIYGVPTRVMTVMTDGWILYNNAAASLGFEAEDFQKPFWELDDVLAQLYEANGNNPFIAKTQSGISVGNLRKEYCPNVLDFQMRCYYELIGSCFAIDHRSGTPQVINYLDTDYTRNCQAAMQRYKNAGYFLSDDYSKYYVMNWSVYADDIYQGQYASMTAAEETMIPSNVPYVIPFRAAYGITNTSQHKEEALMLLELLANDQAFLELVLFGDTDIDKNCSSKSFLSAYSELILSEKSEPHHVAYPAKDGSTVLETHRQMLDNAVVYYDITFDFSSVQKETDAVNEVLKRYLGNFAGLTEAEYSQMLTEIREAGGDVILSELQSQLSAWLSENEQG